MHETMAEFLYNGYIRVLEYRTQDTACYDAVTGEYRFGNRSSVKDYAARHLLHRARQGERIDLERLSW